MLSKVVRVLLFSCWCRCWRLFVILFDCLLGLLLDWLLRLFRGLLRFRQLLLNFFLVLLDLLEFLFFVLLLVVDGWLEGGGSSILLLVINLVGLWKLFFGFTLGFSLGAVGGVGSGGSSSISVILRFARSLLLVGLVNRCLGELLESKLS